MVIVLLLRIRVGKRWGLGTIRSDTFRQMETFPRKKEQKPGWWLGGWMGEGGVKGGGSTRVTLLVRVARLWRHGICRLHTNVNIPTRILQLNSHFIQESQF